ncbi:MAG TPA: VOC family protein [Acidisoma sp.]|jgi:catechol 2,3-dioxygenase-like lactoylglutathione lyase family enzyme|nr:VOC family protein [Acidisoma sp.]
MSQRIASVTVLVTDYDQAIAFFAGTLGFELTHDRTSPDGKRWVEVRPEAGGPALRLALPAKPEQRALVGAQAGSRVLFVLYTDDLERDVAAYKSRGVVFQEEPRDEAYGTVAVFEDCFGNRWDLIQPA